ncbi:DUF6597 domain-containing transcriptional factor [Altericista sp. CCNU0014]|uniref:DUF6597 domain-containing transcriptional factor n=1 Tax=Altericista sp. CCNU0014 TaxID=3082949 RepID=UPI00384A6DF7
MLYQTYQPRSPLSQFVELLWSREGENLPKTQSRLLPIGSMELVINLYAEDIVMIEGDGTVTTGKEACRQGRAIFFDKMLVEFRESRSIDQNIAVSADRTYDFVVVSNWYNDFTIRYGDRIIDNKSNQLSIGYWKDGLVVKESYNYPVILMT